jgi:hypothetical protein
MQREVEENHRVMVFVAAFFTFMTWPTRRKGKASKKIAIKGEREQ